MTQAVQQRRGTTGDHASFTGLQGEITVDTTKKTVVVHDGVTAGGFPLARASAVGDMVASTSIRNIVTMFQRDYDELTDYDLETLYVIVPFRYALESGSFAMTGNALSV